MNTIGIIGGSGIYEIDGIAELQEVDIDTPYGKPSDTFRVGRLGDAKVVFLARHGRGHTMLPHEVNYAANLWGLKSLGVDWLISLSAVGSLREDIHPGDMVLVDQFIDRTTGRTSTFFGNGAVAHVSLADPVSSALQNVLLRAATPIAKEYGFKLHVGGTYIAIQGPQFSSRAESEWYRSMGVSVIGMTNMPEAKLAREAEISYSTLAMVTDYDCWHVSEAPVTVEAVLAIMRNNAERSKKIVEAAIPLVPEAGECPAQSALKYAVLSPLEKLPQIVRQRLHPLIRKYL